MANKNWLDVLIEAAEDNVDDVISSAISSNDAQEITDVNQAGTEVKDSDVSDDPEKLVYYKVNTFSQDKEMGEENVAGTIERDIDSDTDTSVASGNETKAAVESAVEETLDQLVAEGYITLEAKRDAKAKGIASKVKNLKTVKGAGKKGKVCPDCGKPMSKCKCESAIEDFSEVTLTPDELRDIYTETVSSFINERKSEINKKYKEKVAAAKQWKGKKAADVKGKGKKGVKESANVTEVIDSLIGNLLG